MTAPTSTSVQGDEFAWFCDEDGKLTEVIEDAGILDSVKAGEKFTAVLLMEKHCEPRKSVGIVKMAPLCGFAGRFVRGGRPMGS